MANTIQSKMPEPVEVEQIKHILNAIFAIYSMLGYLWSCPMSTRGNSAFCSS